MYAPGARRARRTSESGSGTGPPWSSDGHHAKSGQGNAYAERQNQHGGQGEGASIAEHASAVGQVLTQAIEPGPAPDLARVFAQAQVIAEMRPAVWRQLLAVVGHLLGHLTLEAAAIPEIRKAPQ